MSAGCFLFVNILFVLYLQFKNSLAAFSSEVWVSQICRLSSPSWSCCFQFFSFEFAASKPLPLTVWDWLADRWRSSWGDSLNPYLPISWSWICEFRNWVSRFFAHLSWFFNDFLSLSLFSFPTLWTGSSIFVDMDSVLT